MSGLMPPPADGLYGAVLARKTWPDACLTGRPTSRHPLVPLASFVCVKDQWDAGKIHQLSG